MVHSFLLETQSSRSEVGATHSGRHTYMTVVMYVWEAHIHYDCHEAHSISRLTPFDN